MTGVPIDDRGLLLGDGLFETVLFKAGRAVLWEQHLARLARGCAALGLPAPDADGLTAAARCAVEAVGLDGARAAVRLTWTAGSGGRGLERPSALEPRLIASAAPSARPLAPIRVLISGVRRNAGSPLSRLKTLSYLDNVLARREALSGGADEALMLNSQGQLACAAASNLFWIAEDRLYTPALSCGVLDGIMRGETIAAARRLGAEVLEVEAEATALDGAQALFLTNSLIGLRRIAERDGAACGDHPLVERLEQALDAFV
jgi:branched-subunit amino acid aminotransferase/4-amino-4-deoxychorismate lyase